MDLSDAIFQMRFFGLEIVHKGRSDFLGRIIRVLEKTLFKTDKTMGRKGYKI